MDWVKHKLHETGQYMLEALCSRLSYDICQFNRLPGDLRQPFGEEARTFKLFRSDRRGIATVCWKSDDRGTSYKPPIIDLRADDRNVRVSFPNSGHLSQIITFIPAENKWRIVAGGFDPRTVSDVWEISRDILRTHLFPPVIN